MRLRSGFAALALAGASQLMTGGPIAAAPSTTAPLWVPGLAHSEDIDGPTVAHGRLFGRDGNPASGTVYAVAWPKQSTLAALKDGDKVKTLAIAQAAANGQGYFRLRVDSRLPLAEYTEANGTINIDIRAGGADGLALYGVSRRYDPKGPSGPRWIDVTGADSPGVDPPGLSLALGEAGKAAMDANTGVPLPAADNGPCDEVKATYSNITTAIGETYPGPHAKATFHYEYGQTSSLGVGVSADGAYGSYSQGYTTSSDISAGIDFPQKTYNSAFIYQTTFTYKKFHVYDPTFCAFDYGYEVRPTSYGGAVLGYTPCCLPSTPYSQPVTVVPTTLWKKANNAVTWSDAVKIGAFIGINLSGRTGYSNTAKVEFYFTAVGSLRGNDDRGYVYSSRVRGY